MSVRGLVNRRLGAAGSEDQQPKRSRVRLFAVLTLAAGALSGIAAMFSIPPFGSLHTLLTNLFPSSGPPQIAANTLFPPVPVVHKVVDVYDPPPSQPRPVQPAPQPPATAPSPTPTPHHAHPSPSPSPSPPLHGSPSPSPGGGD